MRLGLPIAVVVAVIVVPLSAAGTKPPLRVNVSGTGFGKPNANGKNWKVVVTYDCP